MLGRQFGFASANPANATRGESSNRMKRLPNGEHTRTSADPMSAGNIGFQKSYAGKHRAKPQARYDWGTGTLVPRD